MDRPRSIRIQVAGSGITVDNGSPNSPERSKVWARAGGNVAFVIENHDVVAHDVWIPINEIVPSQKPEHKPRATPDPMVPGQDEKLTVNGGDVGVLVFQVQPAAHFGFDRLEPWKSKHDIGMTYKYNIHTSQSGGKKMDLDPDIEIIQP